MRILKLTDAVAEKIPGRAPRQRMPTPSAWPARIIADVRRRGDAALCSPGRAAWMACD